MFNDAHTGPPRHTIIQYLRHVRAQVVHLTKAAWARSFLRLCHQRIHKRSVETSGGPSTDNHWDATTRQPTRLRMTHSISLHARAVVTIGLMVLVQPCGAVSPPAPIDNIPATAAPGLQPTVFAGGFFSAVEAAFRHVKGVSSAASGYAGGTASTADDTMVSRGRTGHAESVRVIYDPTQVSYGTVLQVFFSVAHDPTQLNRQGHDVGIQYRSVRFTTGEDPSRVAKAYIAQLDQANGLSRRIVTQVLPLPAFYPAESKY